MTASNPATSIILNQDILSEACLDDIQQYFWTRSIELLELLPSPDPGIYQGTGTLLNVNCQIEALSKADQSLFILCAKPQETPTFGTCFPLMPGESKSGNSAETAEIFGTFLLRFISLQDPLWLYIYSDPTLTDREALQTELDKQSLWKNQQTAGKPSTLPTKNGLYLWGKLPDATLGLGEPLGLGKLATFIDIKLSNLLFQASVTFPDSFPVLTLQLPLGTNCDFGPRTLKQATIEFSSPLYFSPNNNSQINLIGALDLKGVGEIDININFPLDSDLITAVGTYSKQGIPFIDASDPALTKLKEGNKLGTKLELELEFSKREKTLEKVRFSIDLNIWVLIPNILTLEKLSFTFSVFDPLGSKMVIASIAAQASLGSKSKVKLSCAGYYPTNQFYLSLDSKTPLKIVDLVADLGAQSKSIPDLYIDDLSVEYNLNSQDFLTRVDVAGKWEIIKGVELNRLRFKIYGRVAYSCEILAEFTIAGVTLTLEADYDNDDGGWQFEGSTGYGQPIPVGRLIEDLGHKFGEVTLPPAIAELTIQNLGISFNTNTQNFTFTCEAKFPLGGKEVDITINITITKQGELYTKEFGGYINIGELRFALLFHKDDSPTILLATYSQEKPQSIKLANLVETVSSDATLLSILENIEIDLKDALFAYSKGTKAKVLFGLDIGTNINLSNLPLVGKRLPPEQTVSVDDLQLLIASQDFAPEEIAAFNKLIRPGVTKIPEKPKADSGSMTKNPQASSLPKGLNVAAKMQFGSTATSLALPVSAVPLSAAPQPVSSNQQTSSSSTPAASTSPLDNVTWFELKRSFGPVHFERVGVQYKDAVISFFVDVALSAVGLTLSFEGLSIGSPLSKFEPKYNIQGLGIDYESDSGLEIGGAFLKLGDDFVGTAVIRGEAFTLSAMGAYKELQGSPSLFIYAYLNYPLGGPAFFFVEGLAAGFGYNRHITIPAIEEVRNFPLVEDAIAAQPPDSRLGGSLEDANAALEEKLTTLQKYVQPRVGEHFLAVGVKFNSFKQIDSFALLIVPFGQSFELDVLGISTMTVPSPEEGKTVTPVAQIQMVLKARFAPSEGVLSVQAQLTEQSYVFSPDCRLQGGFAFFSWFSGEHAGDFVITLGGYHPSFRVPAHYPQVPRLTFNWQKTPQLSMKGDAYFALTSNVVMAGGHFEALWDGGDLQAWYRLGIDFLISWKPFHYEASAYIDIGASYTFSFFGRHTISVHVGADVEIWGPEFAGTAHVDLSIISFEISFGDRTTTPPKLKWDEFKKSFLPEPEKICSISVGGGLIGTSQQNGTEHWIINPKEFCLVTNTLVPVFKKEENSQFGIAPMQLINGGFTSSELSWEVERGGKGVTEEFEPIAIQKQFPSALWGNNHDPHDTLNSEVLLAIGGYEIRPKNPPKAGSSSPIARKDLDYDVTPRDLQVEPKSSLMHPFTDLSHSEDFYAELRNLAADKAQKRNDLLGAFGFEPVDLSPSFADMFL